MASEWAELPIVISQALQPGLSRERSGVVTVGGVSPENPGSIHGPQFEHPIVKGIWPVVCQRDNNRGELQFLPERFEDGGQRSGLRDQRITPGVPDHARCGSNPLDAWVTLRVGEKLTRLRQNNTSLIDGKFAGFNTNQRKGAAIIEFDRHSRRKCLAYRMDSFDPGIQ